MANVLGRKVAFGLGEETTYGTAVSITAWLPVNPDVSVKVVQESLETGRLAQARNINKLDTAIGISRVETEFGGAFPVEGYGVLLKHLFGKVTTTGYDPSYTHTYEVNPAGLFCGLTAQRHFDAYMDTIAGNKIRSMSFECKVNDFLRYKCSLLGKSRTGAAVSGTPSVTLYASRPYWSYAVGTFTYGGSTYAITGIDWVMNNELLDSEDAAFQLGASTMQLLRTGMFTCEGTIKRRLADDGSGNTASKFYDNAVAGTYAQGVLTFTHSTNVSMTWTFDEMQLEVPEQSTEAGLIIESIKFKCRYDGTNSPVTCVVKDSLSTPATATGTDLLTA